MCVVFSSFLGMQEEMLFGGTKQLLLIYPRMKSIQNILTQAISDYKLCIHEVSLLPVLGKSALIFQ